VLSETPRRGMELLKWTPRPKGTLLGFADIRLPNHLKISGCVLHRSSNGRVWGGFPGKPQIDADGRHITVDGRPQYTRFLQWETYDLANRFSDALVALVCAHHPEAFEEEEPVSPETADA
jgi:hypothetical protein